MDDLMERLQKIALITPECYIGERCAAHEVAEDAIKEIVRLQEQNKKLNVLLENMQADVQNYLMPDKTECNKDWLVSRLIWWLDGPDQREAQKTA